ncbi:MAG: hypothetical protein FWF77_08300 [Defluviitaleaceae bacterium]|nr:hypothetical protein [Defluviitaleaceae bacterium]
MKKTGKFFAFVLAFALLIASVPVLHAVAAEDVFTATLMGQLDADVSDAVEEWGIGDLEDASVDFSIGQEAIISMTFAEPIKFTGNWTGIGTNIPVLSDADAESTNAVITAFVVDGNDLGSREVPLIDRDEAGYLTIDIARQWGGDYDAYDLAGMDPFSSIEITFIVNNMPTGVEDGGAEPEIAVGGDVMGGNAWIGGTFWSDEEGEYYWVEYPEQSVPFEVGYPFTVVLDFSPGTNTHDEASFGYISVVQTDLDQPAGLFDVFVHSITTDGNAVRFEPDYAEVGHERGIRIPMTNVWSDTPMVDGPHRIGEFSRLEVTLALVMYGDPAPVFAEPITADIDTGDTDPAPEPSVDAVEDATDATADGGGPGIIIIVIVAVLAIGVVLFLVMKKK